MMYHVPDATATDSDYNARMLAQRQHNAPKGFDQAEHARQVAELRDMLREIRAECQRLTLRDSTWWKLDDLLPPTPPEYHAAMDTLKAALPREDFAKVEDAFGVYVTSRIEKAFVAGWNAARRPETFIFNDR